jgi:hypothetical protein
MQHGLVICIFLVATFQYYTTTSSSTTTSTSKTISNQIPLPTTAATGRGLASAPGAGTGGSR